MMTAANAKRDVEYILLHVGHVSFSDYPRYFPLAEHSLLATLS